MPQFGLILFNSPAHAVRAEKVLQQAGIPTKMIPTPRRFSADCGLALRFDRADLARVETALARDPVPINCIREI